MAKKKPASTSAIKTTMRIPHELLSRVDKVAKARDRSRSYMVKKFICDGLVKAERDDTNYERNNALT